MSEAGTDAPIGDDAPRARQLTLPWRVMMITWTVLSMALCFNQQFTLRFFMDLTLLDTEYYWALVGLLMPLAFIIYPAKPGMHADHVPLYDIALFLLTTTITSPNAIASVRSTSWIDARTVGVRSIVTSTEIAGEIDARNCGSSALMASTVAMMFAPGALLRISSTAGLPPARPSLRTSWTESTTSATSRR